MANIEADKATRKGKKSAVTRQIHEIEAAIAEDEIDDVYEGLQSLKTTFKSFKDSHDKYHEQLTDDAQQDESENYFAGVQTSYITALTEAKKWLKGHGVVLEVKHSKVKIEQAAVARDGEGHRVEEVSDQPAVAGNGESAEEVSDQPAVAGNGESAEEVSDQPASLQEVKNESTTSNSHDITRAEMLSLINLPKVELETFYGDPMNYHSFIAIFDEHVGRSDVEPSVKLSRLLQFTGGSAKAAIKSCAIIGGAKGYEQARTTLRNRFGDDHLVSEVIIRSIKNGKPVRSTTDLQNLSDELVNCYATLRNMKKLEEIDTQSCIVGILERLQPYIRNRWKRQALETKRDKGYYPGFGKFVKFIESEADEATDPVYGHIGASRSNRDGRPATSSFSSNVKPSVARKLVCKACEQNHHLFACPTFKGMKPPARLKFVRDHKLCENCLYANHKTSDCRKSSVCDVPGCGAKHTKFIHIDPVSQYRPSNFSSSQNVDTEIRNNRVEVTNAVSDASVEYHVPVIPVQVQDKKFNVLLDTASTNTFCTQRLVDELGITGKETTYTLNTLTSKDENRKSPLVDFEVKSLDGTNALKLCNVYVVSNIPAKLTHVDVRQQAHLRGIPLGHVGSQVDILIGQDHSAALVPLQSRKGSPGDPFAVRTLLGWCLNGPAAAGGTVGKQVVNHFIAANIEQKVEQLWQIENDSVGQTQCMSPQDVKVLELWDSTVKSENGHYVLPISWKNEVTVPNNKCVAMSRLKSLRGSLAKRNLTTRYDTEISKLLSKGYAEKVPIDSVNKSNDVWYLPHQAVVTDKKPGKVRVVFDCSAKYMGESLNDKCLQGPDLNNKLQHVLLRFRRHQYAVMADIEAMYNQVRIPVEDRDFLRFLWIDETGAIQQYRMTSHLFGGVWCASAATYALRRTLQDGRHVSDLVSDTVMNAFYVDDCLQSISSKQEAAEVIHGTRDVLSTKGFNLTKFVVNDESLLMEVPEAERASEVKDFQADNTSKALGVKWNPKSDCMYFELNAKCDVINRRSMLSLLSSMFDPLGMLSPVLIGGKIMFQDVTRLKIGWDDSIPCELSSKWYQWVYDLGKIKSFKIPRCVKPSDFDDAYVELHHFSDASEKAYGACSYLRSINKDGRVHTALLYSKSRVAPLKYSSIPRLELQAALLAAKCDSMIRNELHLDLGESTFWVDSQIVLQYINNEKHRLHVYVGNRVGEIHRLTEPRQWRHIPGADNPADIISRGVSPDGLTSSDWFDGPAFLHTYRSEWRRAAPIDNLLAEDPEVRSGKKSDINVKHVLMINVNTHPLDVLTDYYSSWYKLKRAVCWWTRLIHRLKSKVKDPTCLTVKEMKDAEVKIIKHAQAQYYEDDVKRLKLGMSLSKSSPLRDLTPFLDPTGVLRVGGRIQHANMLESKKHPLVIPHKHRIAKLIVQELHDVAHLGVEWTLSLLRVKYWVTRARVVIKSVKSSCVTCKKLFSSPCVQQMADLPVERLTPGQGPFKYTGIDCFGPFPVKLARATVKRYGIIFTCLTCRAVHIEKIDTLDTDSFLNALRRFTSRRGNPVKIWCDNGTNFVGGVSELSKALKEMNKHKLQQFAIQQSIEWSFNPPHASHMGGIWERLIRVIRRVFAAILKDCRLTDEILQTLFAEAESIINSRPITKVSDKVDDLSALSPNHLLIMREGPMAPPGEFKLGDMYRKRWRYTQHLVNEFWKRWQKEYIPELMKRHKWTDKQRNIRIGDLVLLVEEGTTPRGLWPLGVITDVVRGRDDLVRSVRIKTSTSVLVRPVTKIVLLEATD